MSEENYARLDSYADDMSTCTLTNGDGIGYFYNRVDLDLPTTGFTGVDMANAAADGFRDGKASVVVDLSKHHGGQHLPGTERMFLSDVIAAIEAAGGSVKK